MERGVYHPEKSVSGWRHAWKEVFRGTGPNVSIGDVRDKTQAPHRAIKEIREIRNWIKEVRGMAGRGMSIPQSKLYDLVVPAQGGKDGVGVVQKTSSVCFLESPTGQI